MSLVKLPSKNPVQTEPAAVSNFTRRRCTNTCDWWLGSRVQPWQPCWQCGSKDRCEIGLVVGSGVVVGLVLAW